MNAERNLQKSERDDKLTLSIEDALARVRKALTQIGYGEVIVKVEAGKPIWVDKYERERVG